MKTMKIGNDHNGNVNGDVNLSKWEVDLICDEEHPDLDVASKLHTQMNALFNLMEDKKFPYTK
jgi:hypothetical protein